MLPGGGTAGGGLCTLPPELAAVLTERNRICGTREPTTVFTDDVQFLEVGGGEDHWARGKKGAQFLASLYTPDSRFVANASGRHPERLVAFCSVNPMKGYAITERCAAIPGVRGMKLHFGNSGVDVTNPSHVEKVRAFFQAANEKRMALVVHLWTLDPAYGRRHSELFLREILPAAPDITVQIAHWPARGATPTTTRWRSSPTRSPPAIPGRRTSSSTSPPWSPSSRTRRCWS